MNNLTKVRLFVAGIAVSASLGAAPKDSFSSRLSPEDFTSAGLEKLTPAERSRLDALVQAFKSESRERSQARPAPAGGESTALASESRSESHRPPASPEVSGKSWLRRIKLTPGTTIEYETLETELTGTFAGWREGTVFVLGNGQKWQVVSGTYVTPPDHRPRLVKVKPGAFGSFFLEIEGINSRPKVRFVGTTD